MLDWFLKIIHYRYVQPELVHRVENGAYIFHLFWGPADLSNLLVAFATLALALITVITICQTRGKDRADERRHQQTFAPFIECYFDGKNFVVKNKGEGNAMKVKINGAFGTYCKIKTLDLLTKDELERTRQFLGMIFDTMPPEPFKHKVPTVGNVEKTSTGWRKESFTFGERYQGIMHFFPILTTKDAEKSFYGDMVKIFLDGLNRNTMKDGEYIGIAKDELLYEIGINYEDMFGNIYQTYYPLGASWNYQWIRPFKNS